jgi:CBS-domain-containing membrane protein
MKPALSHNPASRPADKLAEPVLKPVAPPQSLLAQSLIGPDASIHTLIERFTTQRVQIGLVIDPQRKLIDTVTDGDLRRGLLRGVHT